MNETEPDFETLRRLLALKKHEVPPPGFFNSFSDNVVSRIRQGESGKPETALERLFVEAPWVLSIIQAFQSKPAFTGVFASAVCLLIVAGIVYTDNPDPSQESLVPSQVSQSGSAIQGISPAFLNAAANQTSLDSSTNPVMSLDPGNGTFGTPNPLLQQVSFGH